MPRGPPGSAPLLRPPRPPGTSPSLAQMESLAHNEHGSLKRGAHLQGPQRAGGVRPAQGSSVASDSETRPKTDVRAAEGPATLSAEDGPFLLSVHGRPPEDGPSQPDEAPQLHGLSGSAQVPAFAFPAFLKLSRRAEVDT